MSNNSHSRILWMSNHCTLMPCEVSMLRNFGFEVFVPKIIPLTPGYRSCKITYEYDDNITIPQGDLDKLNSFDFYLNDLTIEIIKILNTYFDTAIVHDGVEIFISNFSKHFRGRIVLRAVGIISGNSYFNWWFKLFHMGFKNRLRKISDRYWFGYGYESIVEYEPKFHQERSQYLPLGLPDSSFQKSNTWTGGIKKILFVLPEVNICHEHIHEHILAYKKFKKYLGDLPHVIVGSQHNDVKDPNMAGRLPDDEYHSIFTGCEAMFYHNTILRHIHYHPIEAICIGMPVIYMKNSLLGNLIGGSHQPGACYSYKDARRKLRKLLEGKDPGLAKQIIDVQKKALSHFLPEYVKKVWQKNFIENIMAKPLPKVNVKSKKIGMFVFDNSPKNLNLAIETSQGIIAEYSKNGINVECMLGLNEGLSNDKVRNLADDRIVVRHFRYHQMEFNQILVCQKYQGFFTRKYPYLDQYVIPEDDISVFLECDFWLFAGIPAYHAIAPIKSTGYLVSDFCSPLEYFEDKFYQTVENIRNAYAIFTVSDEITKNIFRATGSAYDKTFNVLKNNIVNKKSSLQNSPTTFSEEKNNIDIKKLLSKLEYIA